MAQSAFRAYMTSERNALLTLLSGLEKAGQLGVLLVAHSTQIDSACDERFIAASPAQSDSETEDGDPQFMCDVVPSKIRRMRRHVTVLYDPRILTDEATDVHVSAERMTPSGKSLTSYFRL